MEKLAVVIITYNSAELLPDLFESFATGFGDIDASVMVVDNASADDSVATARRVYPAAHIVETGCNAGYSAGINAGVAAAPSHTCVLVLNPDVRLLPGCVPALIETLRQPGVGIAVPHLVNGDGVRLNSLRRQPTITRMFADAVLGGNRAGRIKKLGESISAESAYQRSVNADWAEGSTMLISSDCWDASGPWDESFFLYSEETEYALRARDHGFATRYNPSAHAVHLKGDSAVSPPLWALLTTNRVRLYKRRHGWLRGGLFWSASLLRESTRSIRARPTNRAAVRALLSPTRMREQPGPHTIGAYKRRANATASRQFAGTSAPDASDSERG